MSDPTSDSPHNEPTETRQLIDALRSENAFLRDELTARTEEIRRRDHIIASFIERVPELGAGQPAHQDISVSWEGGPPGGAGADATRSAWRRWWRRMTGGAVDLS